MRQLFLGTRKSAVWSCGYVRGRKGYLNPKITPSSCIEAISEVAQGGKAQAEQQYY